MDRIISDFYVVDNKLYNSENINFQFNVSSYRTYEVMRCTQGVLIFMDDHIERMEEGIKRLKKNISFSKVSTIENLNLLIKQIKNFEGNVKLLARLDKHDVHLATYGITYKYPGVKMYKEGITVRTFPIERPNPLIKQIHVADSISEKIGKCIKIGIYEPLLVDYNNYITEGSKSNFFLIRNNCLFSAPEDMILHGITRKYVLRIAEEKGIPVIHQKISCDNLENYEAAFICGTSSKILPVKNINNISFDAEHSIIKILMNSYNTLLKKYIYDKQLKGNITI